MRLLDVITRSERAILREHHGSTVESRAVRAKLHEHGLRFCRGCDRVKPLRKFGPHVTHGLQHRCGACAGRKLLARAPFVRADEATRAARASRNVLRSLAAKSRVRRLAHLEVPVAPYVRRENLASP